MNQLDYIGGRVPDPKIHDLLDFCEMGPVQCKDELGSSSAFFSHELNETTKILNFLLF